MLAYNMADTMRLVGQYGTKTGHEEKGLAHDATKLSIPTSRLPK